MREIKFRAKAKHNNQWFESMTIAKGTIKRKKDDLFMEIGDDKWIGIISETLAQFTGVIDVNGKEIFEGDILEVLSIEASEEEILKKLEVYFDIELCSFQFRQDWEPFNSQFRNDFKIIGNIYDNPELLSK